MIIRPLPFDEWDKLEGLPIFSNGYPDPDMSVIIVAEDTEGAIVGVWGAFRPVLLDGLWIREDHRHTTVAGRLLHTMKDFLRSVPVDAAYTYTEIPEVLELAKKAGFKVIPGDICLLNLNEVD